MARFRSCFLLFLSIVLEKCPDARVSSALLASSSNSLDASLQQLHKDHQTPTQTIMNSSSRQDLPLFEDFNKLNISRKHFRIRGQVPRYFVLASRVVRPGHVFRISINVPSSSGAQIWRQSVRVYAAIYRDFVELNSSHTFCTPGTLQHLDVLVPANAGPGHYTLLVRANERDELEGSLLSTRSTLLYSDHTVAVTVQLSQLCYQQSQTVQFRIVLTSSDMGAFTRAVYVAIVQPGDVVVEQWPACQSNSGMISLAHQLSTEATPGVWQVKVVSGDGQTHSTAFTVVEFAADIFQVAVDTPLIHWVSPANTAAEISVRVEATWTVGGATIAAPTGHAGDGRGGVRMVLKADVTPLSRRNSWPLNQLIVARSSQFSGSGVFPVALDTLSGLLRELANSEVRFVAEVVDPVSGSVRSGHCVTRLLDKNALHVRLLGGEFFQPRVPSLRLYLVARRVDGSQISRFSWLMRNFRQNINVSAIVTFDDGREESLSSGCSIWPARYRPGLWVVKVNLTSSPEVVSRVESVRSLLVEAAVGSNINNVTIVSPVPRVTLQALRTSHNLFLHISTSTLAPRIGEYIVLHLRASFVMREVHCVIMSRASVLTHRTIHAPNSPIHTFSLDITGDMTPAATILVYHLTRHGRIVHDTLHFSVSGLISHNMTISVLKTSRARTSEGTSKMQSLSAHPTVLEVGISGRVGDVVMLGVHQAHWYRPHLSQLLLNRQISRFFGGFGSSVSAGVNDPPRDWSPLSRDHGDVTVSSVLGGVHKSRTLLADTLANCALVAITDAHLPSDPSTRNSTHTTSVRAHARRSFPAVLCNISATTGRLYSSGEMMWRCVSTDACYTSQQRCDGVRNCDDLSDETDCNVNNNINNNVEDNIAWRQLSSVEHLLRRRSLTTTDFLPAMTAAGLWGHVTVGQSGHVILQSAVGQMTSSRQWVVSAVAVSPGQPSGYTLAETQFDPGDDLQLAVDLPLTCRLGEQLGMRVTVSRVSRDRGRPISVNVVLARSPHYKFIDLADFKQQVHVRRESEVSAEHVVQVSLPAGDRVMPGSGHVTRRVLTLPVTALTLGVVSVHVYLEYHGVIHNCTHTLLVQPNSVAMYRYATVMLDLDAPSHYASARVFIGPPVSAARRQMSLHVTAGVSPPSAPAESDCEWDGCMSIEHTFCQLSRLIRQLSRADPALSAATDKARLKRSLSISVQNMLAFRTKDGAFSRYKNNVVSPVWSSAHCLRIMSALLRLSRPLYSLPEPQLAVAVARWLSLSQLADGRFVEPQGRSDDGDLSVTLTAQVTVALQDAVGSLELCRRRDPAQCDSVTIPREISLAIDRGMDFLQQFAANFSSNTSSSSHPLPVVSSLHVALVALALSHRPGRAADRAFLALSDRASNHAGHVYWSDVPQSPPVLTVRHRRQYHTSRRPLRTTAAQGAPPALLGTAAALVTHVRLQQWHVARDIARWLLAQQLAPGVWGSCATSMAVLQALDHYWSSVAVSDTRAHCTLPQSSLSHASWSAWRSAQQQQQQDEGVVSITLNSSVAGRKTAPLQLSDSVADTGEVHVSVSGVGVVLLHVTSQYWQPMVALHSSPAPSDDDNFITDVFSIESRVNRPVSHSAQLTLSFCVSCVRSSVCASLGSSVTIKHQLPSGYTVAAASLRALRLGGAAVYNSSHSGDSRIRAAVVDARTSSLLVLAHSVGREPLCAEALLVRWHVVANLSQYLAVTVFNSLQPDYRSQRAIQVPHLTRVRLCDACGSYQCGGVCHLPATKQHVTTGRATTAQAPLVGPLTPLLLLLLGMLFS